MEAEYECFCNQIGGRQCAGYRCIYPKTEAEFYIYTEQSILLCMQHGFE